MRRSLFSDLPKLQLKTADGIELVDDYPAIAKAYAESVVEGWVSANRLIVLACKRYLKMLEMAEDPSNSFIFSPLHVIDYCSFAEKLSHFESGTWELTQVDADGNVNPRIILEPWQIWAEAAIQGFRRRLHGDRLVSTALEFVPRKNAKSLKATVAALYDLCCSGGMAPEIPIAAASARQADDTLFGDVVKMVNNEPDLVENFKLRVTNDEIRCDDNAGRIFKLTGQGEKQDGLNPSLAVFEEGHGGAASVYRVVDSAFGARPNALRRMITTAGYRPEGPAYELMQDAKLILEGLHEDWTFFAAVYALDREDYIDPDTNAIDWNKILNDEELVRKVNPMYEISLDPLKIRGDMEKAKRRADLRGEFARTRLNIWTGAGMMLIEPADWAKCKRDIQIEDFFGMKCWIGVDLAQYHDMCAIVLMFELSNGTLALFAKHYLPRESPTAIDPDLMDFISIWEDKGDLVLTDGPMADHDLVREDVEAFCELFDVQVIACDPAQAHNTAKQLYDGQKPVVIYPNSAKTMTAPTDDLLGRVASQTLIHDGNPVLAWNAQNVHGERKGNGSILPRKDKPDSMRKIDGFVAACFANGCRMQPEEGKPLNDEKPTPADVYLTRGLIGFNEGLMDNG